jgi:hypothetical protein
MPNCLKLLEQARNSPSNLRFTELCQLAECHGFVLARQSSSHRLYKYPRRIGIMNFQSDSGKAKAYQVKQLLVAIEELEEKEDRTDV